MLSKISQKKLSTTYFTHMYDMKLKVTNEQIRKLNKQKLVDTDNSMVVTRGKVCGRY